MSQTRFFEYLKTNKKPALDLLIVQDAKEAASLADVAKFFELDHIVFPDFRARFKDDLRPFKEELFELFASLRSYHQAQKKPLIISPLKTLLFSLPKPEVLQSISIEFGGILELKSFKEQMFCWGYEFVDIVQMEGEISFRGDIIDIFVPSTPNPIRVSLFDNEIEQIKEFELETQRTLGEELESFTITAAFYSLDEARFEELQEKIKNSDSDSFVKDLASLGFWHLDDLADNFLEGKKALFISKMQNTLDEAFGLSDPQISREFFNLDIIQEEQRFHSLVVTDAKAILEVHKRKKITLIASNEAQIKQSALFELQNIKVVYSPIILNVIGEEELILSLNKPEKKRRRRKTSILLDDLKTGDYVVHEDYGVGIFEAIEQMEILGGVKDFIVIRYIGDDKVLLPVENLDYIDRYIAGGGSLPVLDRLGKGSFAKLKESVKTKLFEIASSIVNTAAARALIKAPRIEVAKKVMQEFQSSAGFDYTDDQKQSIAEILSEISHGHIMDKLLSGDVGFGKTEVAMNAIYATCKAGFQSALIVPTTLLSSQHYKSLEKRFADMGVRVAKLDRFISAKERKNIEIALKEGIIDVVVGTHAIFGVSFAKLGLVIVDEEHKFGVKQKEKIKELYNNIHMLSMSATPIPRSLNQALSSIKTMSTLQTPPVERQGVRTFVKSYDEKLIKEVILRELRRGGQVFYVHNSIDHMPIKYGELKAILPELRMVMLHSQVSAADTEKELLKFENREYDLMIATSIIESGIHMPSVNTMIIDGADRFGIADLHQLRGRVGRSNVEGFAYFIVEDKDAITDEAKKRLVALESNSFLGSGSVLAYHDLEIRGGGNLVGDAQSGHIKNIGYSLYLRMLEDAIKELSNKVEEKKAKVDIKLAISAYISDMVVSEDRLRLDLYRRLSQAEDVTEIYEIEEETVDRFGALDEVTKQFFELMVIKLLSLGKKIKTVTSYAQNITFVYQNDSKETISAPSKDDDDIVKATLFYLRNSKPKVL